MIEDWNSLAYDGSDNIYIRVDLNPARPVCNAVGLNMLSIAKRVTEAATQLTVKIQNTKIENRKSKIEYRI
jgi:hypothetical protein